MQQLCEHLPLFIKSFIYHIIYRRENRRRKSKRCRRMRRPTADFENTDCTTQLSTGLSLQSLRSRFFVDVVVGQQV